MVQTLEASTVEQVSGLVRRVRRSLDLSQRELASRLGTSSSTIARAESEGRISVGLLCQVLSLAGCRLTGVDEEGRPLVPMRPDAPRNRGGRRYPAHLDAQYPYFRTPHLAAWFLGHGWDRHEPILTFRGRARRDESRRPGSHLNPVSHPLGRRITAEDDHPSDREFRDWREPWRVKAEALAAEQAAARARHRNGSAPGSFDGGA